MNEVSYHSWVLKSILVDYSNEVFIRVKVIIVSSSISYDVVKIHLVPGEASNSSKSFHKLEAIWWLISDEFQLQVVVFVVQAQPVGKLFRGYNFQVHSCLWILEVFWILLLNCIQKVNFNFVFNWVLDLVPSNLNVFKEQNCFQVS